MKLRLCSLSFKTDLKIQVNDHVKTMKSGKIMNLIELGRLDSFGRPHFCGIISEHIINIKMVQKNIDKLEKMSALNRIEWFSKNFPKADLIKIDNEKLLDPLQSSEDGKSNLDVVIMATATLTWGK